MGEYNFYNGGISSFEKNYGIDNGSFIGYRSANVSSNLGFPGSTQTANQVKEAINAIKQGVKSFEVTMGVGNTAEQIPKQHFEEMKALMKLTGVKPSVHAPFDIDASGFGQQGYSKEDREENQRRLFNVLERAHELNPNGNVPVVMHSTTAVPGSEYSPGEGEDRFHVKKMVLIDKETGQLATQVKEEIKYYPRPEDLKEGGTLLNPLEEIHTVNASKWDQTLTGLAQFTKMADEVIGNNVATLYKYKDVDWSVRQNQIDLSQSMAPEEQHAYQKLHDASIFLQNAQMNFSGAFNTAYKYGTDEQREELTQLAEKYRKDQAGAGRSILSVVVQRNALDKAVGALQEITHRAVIDKYSGEEVAAVPMELVPVEEFAREEAAKTFGNLAYDSFSKLGKGDASKAPMLAIENMYQGMAFAKPEDMKQLVEDSRAVFVKNAVKKGMDEEAAKAAAEKLLGVTWDVGHLNMMKKYGFEDKDVISATEKIKDYVKHVHLTDNFGYSDSHLAPGMGNVPIKKILEELEKTGRLGEMSKIVEAPGFVQHFGKSPHGITLAALGAPIYGSGGGSYWNQVTNLAGGGYFGGPLAYLPEKHFSLYGTGFSSLPTELGGQIPGTASRFSGTPNT